MCDNSHYNIFPLWCAVISKAVGREDRTHDRHSKGRCIKLSNNHTLVLNPISFTVLPFSNIANKSTEFHKTGYLFVISLYCPHGETIDPHLTIEHIITKKEQIQTFLAVH